jgi:histidine ammonia-lyase
LRSRPAPPRHRGRLPDSEGRAEVGTAIEPGIDRVGIADVVRVARGRAIVTIAPAVVERLRRAREVIEGAADGDRSIYGLTSALGANTGRALAPEERRLYQVRAVRARAVGVGPAMPEDQVRATMFARIAGMAQGGSGVSIGVFRALVDALNRSVFPCIPAWGSISVADMPPLAHLALVLIGEGEAFIGGRRVPGAEALAHAGLTPAALGAKDGLSLFSANAVTVGFASLVLHDLADTFGRLDDIVALSFEGFRANLSPLDPRAQAARPAPGQATVAARIGASLVGSGLLADGAARRVQDPLSFRCVSQVHGAALDALAHAVEHIEIELNARADSPLVDAATGAIFSTGNFHIPGLAITHEALGLAVAQVGALIVERCIHLLAPVTSDLPLQLTRHGPQQSGFATVQKTLTALLNHVRHLANPACLDFLPVSAGIEDHAPMALKCVSKLAEMRERLVYLAAIEAVVGAQAVDLRAPQVRATLGQGARRMYEGVRERVPFLDDDRPLGVDIERVAAWLLAMDAGKQAKLGTDT